jgi:hypothetical protein
LEYEGSWRWSMTLGTPRPADRYLRTRRPTESSYCTMVVWPWRDQDSPGTHPKNYQSAARRVRLGHSAACRFNRPHRMDAYWSTQGIRVRLSIASTRVGGPPSGRSKVGGSPIALAQISGPPRRVPLLGGPLTRRTDILPPSKDSVPRDPRRYPT